MSHNDVVNYRVDGAFDSNFDIFCVSPVASFGYVVVQENCLGGLSVRWKSRLA